MASPSVIRLTGDPEIDATVPRYPKVLPEITWLTVSATRVMAMGGLTAPIYPARVKCLSLLEFVQQLDGRTALEDWLAAEGELLEARHYYLRNLFQAGLLECGDGPEQPVRGAADGLSAFLARTLDQTRLNNRRDQALQLLHEPLAVQDLAPELVANLRELGMNLVHVDQARVGQFALLGIEPGQDQDTAVEAMLAQGCIVIPVFFHGAAVDIGPILATQGGSRYADYRTHFLSAPALAEAPRRAALAALAAQFVLLLGARTSPIQLSHTVLRISLDAGRPSVERLPLVREQALAVGLCPESQDRLARHARISVPSLRYVGTKAHEVHYSPKNLAVAREVPVAAEESAQVPAASRSVKTARLLAVIERAFGYRSVKKYGASRICPTGGNLGSPECLVLIKRGAEARVYRYIPVKNALEPVSLGLRLDAPVVQEEVSVICLGNREKTTRKYNEFGENLACIDSGVALAYFKASAEVTGLEFKLDEDGPQDPVLAQVLDARSGHYRLMWSGRVREAGLGSRLGGYFGRRRALDRRIEARKAHRLYCATEVGLDRVEDLLVQAIPALPAGPRRQVLAPLTAVALVKTGGRYQVHALQAGAPAPRLERLPVAARDQVAGLFMQTRLSDAPVQVFFLTPLHQVLAAHGPQGHDTSLSLAGEWVARLWLELAEHGLVGCPCGAAVESDLLAQLPPRFADHYNLFSFVFGQAAS